MKRIKFVFDIDSISGLQMLNLVERLLSKFCSSPEFFLHGAKTSIKVLERKILQKKSWPSGLKSSGFELRFGVLPAKDHCFLVIEETERPCLSELEDKIGDLLETKGFIQAWISDIEYDFWQNATDPLEYECAGRSISGLPMRSNGLPSPLNQMEVDTSENPGRIVLREGYIEAIGSTIWLGDHFWGKVGKNRFLSVSLLKDKGFAVYDLGNFLKIVTPEDVFFDYSTLSNQRALRSILFDLS